MAGLSALLLGRVKAASPSAPLLTMEVLYQLSYVGVEAVRVSLRRPSVRRSGGYGRWKFSRARSAAGRASQPLRWSLTSPIACMNA